MSAAPAPRSGRTRVWVGLTIGILLIAAAAWVISRQGPALRQASRAALDSPWWMVVALLVLPLVNLWLTSMQFWVLTARYGREGVPRGEMFMLIASGWLLNTLPLRTGMFGRIAYHKAIHGIALRDSVRVLVKSLALAVIALAMLMGVTLLARRMQASWVETVTLLCAPALVAGLAAGLLAARSAHAWREPTALVFRYLDMLSWTVRYALVFAMIGKPISSVSAAAVAIGGQAAMLSPVQLGVREWAVGLVGALLPEAGAARVTESTLAAGLMADLINRGAELAVLVPIGTVALWCLYRRWGHRRGNSPPGSGVEDDGGMPASDALKR